jgi:ankyrin repeat protein
LTGRDFLTLDFIPEGFHDFPMPLSYVYTSCGCFDAILKYSDMLKLVKLYFNSSLNEWIPALADGCCWMQECGKPEKFAHFFDVTAAKYGAIEVAKKLIEHNGVNILENEDSVILNAISHRHNKFVEWLLTLDANIIKQILDEEDKVMFWDGNQRVEGIFSPIQLAIKMNNFEIVKLLAEKGAKFDLNDISFAIQNKLYDLARYLITVLKSRIPKLYLNAKDQNGDTLLHHAVRSENLDMVKFILDNGALESITLANNTETTPIGLARNLRNPEITALLEERKKELDEKGPDSKCFIQ